MTLRFPTREFFQSSGNPANLFNEELRDAIAGFSCQLWNDFPSWLTDGMNPAQAFVRGYMNQMCSPLQPAVVAPITPFTGGQCPGVLYDVDCLVQVYNITTCVLVVNTTVTFQVLGPVVGIEEQNITPTAATSSCNGLSSASLVDVDYVLVSASPDIVVQGSVFRDELNQASPPLSSVTITNVTRVDGMPDNCGDPLPGYGGQFPDSAALETTIVITNLDGDDNVYNLTYNKITNQYNFPMGFKLNGTNVSLDLEGITIYGPPQITEPTNGNDVPAPGSDGRDDGVGGNNTITFPLIGYPVVSNLTTPTATDSLIEYVICNEGVIEVVTDTIKLITSANPYVGIILDILTEIITELCEATGAEATVGLPEYYGLRPGVNRPAIVYLWKEFNGTTFGASTYSSTVSNPTAAAVAAIPTLVVPDKTIGPWVTSLNLTDGSRIRATGNTQIESLANFNFLLNQVEPAFIPVDAANQTVVSEYPNLNILTLKLRQIEYYPTGKQAGVSPFIRRVIQP